VLVVAVSTKGATAVVSAGATTVESTVVLVTVVESVEVEVSPSLLQATNVPAMANTAKNFFILYFIKFSLTNWAAKVAAALTSPNIVSTFLIVILPTFS
jgi:hypothetical protein